MQIIVKYFKIRWTIAESNTPLELGTALHFSSSEDANSIMSDVIPQISMQMHVERAMQAMGENQSTADKNSAVQWVKNRKWLDCQSIEMN